MTSIEIRRLDRNDLSFADSLRALAGWNQTMGDWERFIDLEPGGCFLAEWNGQPCGTATTLIYTSELAWIGMVLVHPDYRRRGIGRALLEYCIEYLHSAAVACIKLDATPLGREVYLRMGFQDEWSLTRWTGTMPRVPPHLACKQFKPLVHSDVRLLADVDTRAFGVHREKLLSSLLQESTRGILGQESFPPTTSYGMLRRGSRKFYLGPVVADSPTTGQALCTELLSGAKESEVYWDIPDENEPAKDLAEQLGFHPERALRRMFLGTNFRPGEPNLQFGIAGPETG